MMIIENAHHVIRCGLSFLPDAMTSHAAEAMLLAVGMQESRFRDRRQLVWRTDSDGRRSLVPAGPATGFWQFERIGVAEVLRHGASRALARRVCEQLRYDPVDEERVHLALIDNDILAVVFARLALWRHPQRLALEHEPNIGWAQYMRIWAPGSPHRHTWDGFWRAAWLFVGGAG